MKNLINYNRFVSCTTIEGPGKRFALWVQGCILNCRGCSNQEMIPIIKKNVIDVQELFNAVLHAKSEYDIEGITVLGGEPFIQPDALYELLKLCKQNNLSTIVFSGYYIDLLKERYQHILDNIDVLIDWPFLIDKLDKKRRLIGSTNQRVWKLSNFYENNNYFEESIVEAEFVVDKDNNKVIISGDGANWLKNKINQFDNTNKED